MRAISVSDLKNDFQAVETLSPLAFEAVTHYFDLNGDGLIDDHDIFEAIGTEVLCSELMSHLGFPRFTHLTPKTVYYGECPIEMSDHNTQEKDYCSVNPRSVSEFDAQVAIDFFTSLAIYFKTNADLIDQSESSLLNSQCLVSDEPHQDHSKQIREETPETKRSVRGVILDEKTQFVFIGDKEEDSKTTHTTGQTLTDAAIENDEPLQDYVFDLCLRNEENPETSTDVLMFWDSLTGSNLLDDYSGNHDEIIQIECL